MRDASNEFKTVLRDKNRHLLCWADITLKDGTVLNLSRDNLMQGDGFKIDDATSGTSSFDIGSVIVNQLSLKLNNESDTYSDYDFEDAKVVGYTGLELPGGTVEKIRMGTYTVDDSKKVGITCTLSCLDNIRKFDREYKESKLKYPATLGEIMADACKCCGLTLLASKFDMSDFVVNNRPDDDKLTFREVVQWVAQIACKYVRCDAYGRVFLEWYDKSGDAAVFEPRNFDGGKFDRSTPYSTGADIDGGTFNPWNNMDPDGLAGTFETMSTYHHIWMLNSLNIGMDDIEITGVSVTLESGSEEQSYLYGEAGYVIAIEGNDLIQDAEHAQNAAVSIGNKLIGMIFRTFDAGHLSDPLIEAGDMAYVTDRKQKSYLTYITNTTFNVGATQKSSCGAESPAKKSTTQFDTATKAIATAKKNTKKQISEYDVAVQNITSLITQSFGVFKTEEILDDGSTIYYMHDKPTLEESKSIWKMTADAFAVSTDGGETWNAGMDSSGNAVVNVLSAIGINCDWIHSGTLTLGGADNKNGTLKILDASGNVIGTWDKDGVYAKGKFACGKNEYGRSVELGDGAFKIIASDGSIVGRIIATSNDCVRIEVGDSSVRIMNNAIYFDSTNIGPGGVNGKTGTAEFSDGSYLNFENGFLVGGNTTEGGPF